ncbi:hypothetical protein SAMN05421771_1467 [Granulicella pectinivorans]|uniref:Methyl-accepting chemotaxis protein n=1 Tax=Granulicella pectinivorans TaxID=474950 RepID=A0A1I6LY29_9BACT|nr:hypothetical protein [Granulicella pectinivorans]SFS08340.1 hypothetical protein SAMN05421771_1467 [Granulicella pectinivorans]
MSLITTVQTFVRSLVSDRSGKPGRAVSCAALDRVADLLDTMNRDTEQDFLRIGGRLMDFLQSAGGIAAEIDGVIRSTAGGGGAEASATLTDALERCRRLVASATADRSYLTTLRTEAGQVSSIFGGFRQAVASFHVVCTMTRIESARLGGAGDELSSLTDEVLTLARRMQAQVEHVLDAASAVGRQVTQLALSLRGTDQLLDHLARVVPHVLHSLDAFSAQQEAAATLSTQLAQDSRAISRSMMHAVTSIQFHDITRQQVEHIVAALRHLSAQTVGEQMPESTRTALNLEATQLVSAGDIFDRSVLRLWHDLEAIAVSVEGMAAKGHALVRDHGDDSAFFLEVKHCVDAIAEAVTSHRGAEAASQAAARDLGATLTMMNEAAAEIRGLDVQLLRVALNASVRAAHLGARGDTLSVLASTLRELAASADERSRHAALSLRSMDVAVALLVSPRAVEDDAGLTRTMQTTMETMKAASEQGAARLREVALSASALGEEILAARNRFRAGDVFAETVSVCLTQLHRTAEEAVVIGRGVAAADEARVLETCARRYTMQSERDIHASLTTGSMAAPHLVPAGDAELGDDIELF